MQNRLQINPFTINELSPIGFIAERWEFHENKRVGNKIKIPFSFLVPYRLNPTQNERDFQVRAG